MKIKFLIVSCVLALFMSATMLSGCGITGTSTYYPANSNSRYDPGDGSTANPSPQDYPQNYNTDQSGEYQADNGPTTIYISPETLHEKFGVPENMTQFGDWALFPDWVIDESEDSDWPGGKKPMTRHAYAEEYIRNRDQARRQNQTRNSNSAPQGNNQPNANSGTSRPTTSRNQSTQTTVNQNQSRTNANNSSNQQLSLDQRRFIQGAIDTLLQYLMSQRAPYKNVPMSMFVLRPTRNDGFVGKYFSDNHIELYGFKMDDNEKATIIHELLHYETASFKDNMPEFWREILTESIAQEIVPQTTQVGYKDCFDLYQQLIRLFSDNTGDGAKQVSETIIGYFLKGDLNGLRSYINTNAGANIYDKMTMDANKNLAIINNLLPQ